MTLCPDCNKAPAIIHNGPQPCPACAAKRRVIALGIAALPVRRNPRLALEVTL